MNLMTYLPSSKALVSGVIVYAVAAGIYEFLIKPRLETKSSWSLF